jgi:hypothetical protein
MWALVQKTMEHESKTVDIAVISEAKKTHKDKWNLWLIYCHTAENC